MPTDVELASVIADDHRITQKLVRVDAAPQRALGGDLHRVGRHGERGDAQPFEVRLPVRRIGKLFVRVFREPGNGRPSERMFAHVGQGGIVDHVIGVPDTQQIEEVQATLASRRAEPGEVVVADLRADAVRALVTCPRVIHRNPTRCLQTRAQHVARFGQELILPGDQQTHDLPLGDGEAHRLQQRHQPRHGHLPLVVLHQHEAAQLRPEVPPDIRRQGRDHRPTIRGHPTLAPIADHPHTQLEILHHEILIPFEARALRNLRLEDLLLNLDPRHDLAAPAATAPSTAWLRRGAVLHPTGFDRWSALQPFQARDLLAQLSILAPQLSVLLQQLQQQPLQLDRR